MCGTQSYENHHGYVTWFSREIMPFFYVEADLLSEEDQPQNISLPFLQSLFWSGTYKVAHVYSDSGDRYTTLEDTLAG